MRAAAIFCAALASSWAGCAAHPGANSQASETTVVSLNRIDCASCGYQMVEQLRKVPGIYEADYDPGRAEIVVEASSAVDVLGRARELAEAEGFEALLGAGQGTYESDETFDDAMDYERIAVPPNQELDLRSVLSEGKVTVVDFTASWCQPCREVDAHMSGRLVADDDIAYRKVDVGDWDTAVARQHLERVPALPYVVVFSPDGERVASVHGLDLRALDEAIARAEAVDDRPDR
jgi:thiol-disulfide isomerase/thioredoxin